MTAREDTPAPRSDADGRSPGPTTPTWRTRPERPEDAAALRDLLTAAFPTPEEADLVEALRADRSAWIEGLSWIAHAEGDPSPVAHALLTRAHVDGEPVLALAPCATLPDHQRRGAGSAAIRAALEAARQAGEGCVVVLGHADYYPRFGFTPASRHGITAPFDVPDEAFLARALDPGRPVPRGRISYPPAFGV
jgi:predicted N-acetyltransferase YhbS